ncbi:putative aarF domain-containing protein kinase 1 [Kappamyces sp. JEL0829]|nr:putative aarF domain-containing protein kinase 1 [Kappamyces sp. JEL0829]
MARSWRIFRTRPIVWTTTSAIAAAGILSVDSFDDERTRIEGVARHLRTLGCVARIVWDYKSLPSPPPHFSKTQAKEFESTEDYLALKSRVHQQSSLRLLELCRLNGGCYIKLGQHISSLVYLLPAEYTSTLSVLCDACPQDGLASVKKVFAAETNGLELEQEFLEFDPEPIGSASLAQVHRAVDQQGRKVAVKIQHGYLDQHAAIDIKTCGLLARLVKRVFKDFEFDWLAEEMEANLPLELDFRHEAKNARECRALFEAELLENIYVPQVYLATRRLLIMEYIDGAKITDQTYLKEHHISPSKISKLMGKTFNTMIFKTMFLHCDPHGGNLLVRPRPTFVSRYAPWMEYILPSAWCPPNFEVVLLDHGLYRKLNETFISDYAWFWVSILNGNEKGMEEYCYRMFSHDKRSSDTGIDYHRLFASMISGRSWEALSSNSGSFLALNGITKIRDDKETNVVKTKAGTSKFLMAIALILQKCPRELLLVLKTNDLLRGIDSQLGVMKEEGHLVSLARDIGWSCWKYIVGSLDVYQLSWNQFSQLLQMGVKLSVLEVYS